MVPLHYVSMQNQLDSVDLLCSYGANVNAKDFFLTFLTNGNSPLHYSSKYGHFEVTQALLKRKANANITNN